MSPDPVWVDGSTPLNSVNMTKLQTRDEKGAPSGYVGLDSGSNANVAGVFASGYGGARQVTLSSSGIPSGYAGVAFGSTGDTNLYRAAVNDLRTDGSFMAGTHVQSAGGGANRIMLNADGHIYFGSAADTNLYRSAAGELKTDNWLESAQRIIANHGSVNAVYVGLQPGVGPGITFGSAQDTNLYRSGAGTLTTDGALAVGSYIQVAGPMWSTDSTGDLWHGLLFGSAQDTKLYRAAANALRTPGSLQADAGLFAAGASIFGSTVYINDSTAIDGNTPYLAKYAALSLQSNASLRLNGGLFVDIAGAGVANALAFGSAGDAKLWRIGAGQLGVDALQIQGTYTVGVGSCNLAIGSNRGSGNVTNWVEIGAPDSGGSGYRMLRVPN